MGLRFTLYLSIECPKINLHDSIFSLMQELRDLAQMAEVLVRCSDLIFCLDKAIGFTNCNDKDIVGQQSGVTATLEGQNLRSLRLVSMLESSCGFQIVLVKQCMS